MPVLTDPTEIAEAKANLAEAKKAKHLLSMGQGVASFRDQNGEEVTYTRANLTQLNSYILELQSSLGLIDYRGAGPLQPVFF